MLLVYTHKITPRVTYIFKHIFENMLDLSVSFSTAVEVFVAHSGPKISYASRSLGNEFNITSHSLLFERGVIDQDITIYDWEGIPAFFKTDTNGLIPYDIFAASFFLLSRYEESIPKIKTINEFFDSTQSLAFKEGFLEMPLVDIWVLKLHKIMSAFFTEIKPYKKKYSKKELLIDVPLAFRFRHRSFLVSMEIFLKSIWQLNLLKIFNQFMVLLRLEDDPYDSFDSWVSWFKDSNLKPKVFFHFANSSKYESSISIFNRRLHSKIKKTGDVYMLGLLLSVKSQLKPEPNLDQEKKGFQQLTNRQVKRIRIPNSFRQLSLVYSDLVNFEFTHDYSMGYSNKIGFRASTSTPFYFYDLANESKLSLKAHPVVASESVIKNGKSNEAFSNLERIFKSLPLNCSRLTIAVSNGFLNPKKQNLPLQKSFKNYIK
mgnify:FL=1